MTWAHGEIQHEMPYGIGVTDNFQATSESETLHAKPNQRRQRSHRNAVPGWNTRRNTIRESFVHLSLGQLPSILRENSKIIPGMPRCSCFACVSSQVSCRVSCLVLCLVSSRVSCFPGISRIIRIAGKINRNSVSEAPQVTQNRIKIYPGTLSGRPVAPKRFQDRLGSVSGASWGVPSVPQGHPNSLQRRPGKPARAPGSARERAEATRIDAKSRPGVKTLSFSCEGCA